MDGVAACERGRRAEVLPYRARTEARNAGENWASAAGLLVARGDPGDELKRDTARVTEAPLFSELVLAKNESGRAGSAAERGLSADSKGEHASWIISA